jgi:predicted TIM-barrel fold metal-dependent hydrolase
MATDVAPLPDDYPVIDIHTHTFNALYLPLSNIARGRLGEYPLGRVLNATVTDVLIQAIINQTLKNQQASLANHPLGTLKGLSPSSRDDSISAQLGINAETVLGGGPTLFGNLRSAETPLAGSAVSHLTTNQINQIIGDDENWIRFSEVVFGTESQRPARGIQTLSKRKFMAVEFLKALMSSDAALRQKLPTAFHQQVALFVQHTMDMGPTYAQEPNDTTFWSFHGKQLSRVRELDQAHTNQGSSFLHFVAFSPFRATPAERDSPPADWKESTPINLVKQALENGAWGVKYYPPAGYRPSGNEIPCRPTFGRLQKAQWDSRYVGFSNAELDALNFAFFEFCAENDIPVFAHCSYGEFQAARKYGERMAHPAYYREVLERLAARPKPLHLRLCLGHAGGSDFWFGDDNSSHKEWGEQVYELCTRFPNVYCEVGILAEITDEKARAALAKRLSTLFKASVDSGRYPFASKVIYGTDWFMPDTVAAGISFLEGYRLVFRSEPNLAQHVREFFCLNAMAFLGLNPAVDASGMPNRAALQRQLQPIIERAKR